MISNIQQLRREYVQASLDERDVAENPFEQFQKWFEEALNSSVLEPNAMTLATSDAAGNPSARIVLLKGLADDGFVFFTNYRSRKAEELAQNSRACLLFFWKELERQVRIEGAASKISEAASTEYFQSRPKASQIGAWVSPQSQTIESRELLEQKYQEVAEKYKDSDVLPRPAHWGGYAVKPEKIEFWQGRPSRLHDRILYSLTDSKIWKIERLAP
ncbi:MAG TPA: pyridoxamine 5'-phosphate oxidase [Pyrinomonadaceae bacterium]|jgi:pyridoxamine 5'-phosphate oxidase